MRLARDDQFDPNNPPWLHCISRCVRRAFLCGDGFEHRKSWIERRLKLLAHCYSVEIGAYAIMSNHMHVVARPRPDATADWSAERIAWWCMRYNIDPIDGAADNDERIFDEAETESEIAVLIADEVFIARWRDRMGTVSWFMKALKEPLSRNANKEDNCSGTFWEGRFKSIPLLDVGAIIACMAYVDLNPIRAQLAQVPGKSVFTSIKTRIAQRRARQTAMKNKLQGDNEQASEILRQAGLADTQQKLSPKQQDHITSGNDEKIFPSWLTPIHRMTSTQKGDPGFSLETYIKIVDNTGRIIRGDKCGSIPRDVAEILQRIDASWIPELWCE